jgi:hypothetical protein
MSAPASGIRRAKPPSAQAGFLSPSCNPPGHIKCLYWARSIKTEGIVRSATGDGKIPSFTLGDIADVTIKALTAPPYAGQSLSITGPEALSYAYMTDKSGADW